VIYP